MLFIMDVLHAVILGVVEGLTEFLPISSTGHLILAARVFNVPQTDFVKSFEIIIQLGAILAVIALYYKLLLRDRAVLKKVLAAFIPTGIIGFIAYQAVKKFLLGNSFIVVWALFIGGIVIILFELVYRKRSARVPEGPLTDHDAIASISYPQAIGIGIVQTVSIIPGVSRAAATIMGGLALGVTRKTIVEFSFLLAVPTMLAATVLDLSKNAALFSRGQYLALAVGFMTSFVVAVFAVKWFIAFIQRYSFIVFGVYRIIIALIFLFIIGGK
ncbi:MAG: undecaprenyl-diphosphatase UppP [Candidatus Omnitrophica bacterium]|nr:undecaprenyl-diphosphatase UppP [Candidatus Omnitrophota bacterium]